MGGSMGGTTRGSTGGTTYTGVVNSSDLQQCLVSSSRGQRIQNV